MKKLIFLFFLMSTGILYAQNAPDTVKKEQARANADDPSNFFTRVEVFNELQHYENNVNINQSVLRAIFKLGNKFTTRIDLPYVHNSFTSPAKPKQSGIGDISFRLLGYKIIENPTAGFTASIEISLNTAQSPILGTGKNLFIPVLSYSRVIPKKKMLVSFTLQQTNAVSGDRARANVSFTKLQTIFIKTLSKRTWVVLAPEWYLDYVHGGLSMNLRSRLTYAPSPRINIWITPSAGIFGDFIGRYQWSLDIGSRFFLFNEMKFKKKK